MFCVLASGCVRDPAEAVCPEAAVGDLVVTEIGGPQTGADTLQPWIELYNASGAPIDLLGTKVRFRRVNGSSETAILVRRELVAAPGSYTVLGLDDDTDLESYIDYGFLTDFHTSWLDTAAVDVEACGTRLDRAVYTSLPNTGTRSLGVAPTEQSNEDPANWCTDTTVNPGSFPGSPQRANPACP